MAARRWPPPPSDRSSRHARHLGADRFRADHGQRCAGFGPAEDALTCVYFVAVPSVLGESTLKGLASLFFGLVLGLIGIDPLTGEARLSFGVPQLLDGIDVVIVAVGLFARSGSRCSRPRGSVSMTSP